MCSQYLTDRFDGDLVNDLIIDQVLAQPLQRPLLKRQIQRSGIGRGDINDRLPLRLRKYGRTPG